MCGINGIFNYKNQNIGNIAELVNKMNDSIAHRGPDDEGVWCNKSKTAAFGHRRLSILDLSASGHQPMITEKETVITYNGEVYNFNEIKNKYLKDCKFFSKTDTEVILRLYEKQGIDFLNEINGMFAFAIYDEGKVILVRDRSGKKPLYYTTVNGIFAFSSEIRAILELPWIKVKMDNEGFYHFMTFNVLPAPHSMFEGIKKLYPGHYMVLSENGSSTYKPYWKLSTHKLDFNNEEELEEIITAQIEESVKYRMISDVPVGAFLSGGVDSSAIVSYMRKNTHQEIKTFSIGFEGQPEYDELNEARKVAKLFNTNHFEVIVTPQDIKDKLSTIIEVFDEPLCDTTTIPIYLISELAKNNGLKVILTGDGPDELFAGYGVYLKYNRYYPYYNLLKMSPKFVRAAIKNLYNNDRTPIYDLVHRCYHKQEFFWGMSHGGIKESMKNKMLSADFLEKTKDINSYKIIEKIKEDYNQLSLPYNKDPISWILYSAYRFLDIEKFLFRLDRISMIHSIESRPPFLDYKLIELAFSIPSWWKIKDNTTKYILKKALESILPNDVLYRRKQGFCVPIREWATEIIYDYINNNINEFCNNTGIFNAKEVIRQNESVKNGNQGYTNYIWMVFYILHWYKKWMK